MIGRIAATAALAIAVTAPAVDLAAAGSAYDGRWSLSIVTQKGTCDPSYNFPVEITNGNVSFPGLVKANGRVTAKGAVRVSVSVPGKSASGSGRLTKGSGSGHWTGKSGEDRCSGIWTAQRS
jgi:hypothetical protein